MNHKSVFTNKCIGANMASILHNRANFTGSAPAMEPKGITALFTRSLDFIQKSQ